MQNYILSNSDQGSEKIIASNFRKSYFYVDYQIITLLVKTQKNGPQKSLRAKLCDLRVKTLYLRAEIKIERTKKKGEKLKSCSLGYNELINVSQSITAMLENLKCLSFLVNKTSAPTVIAELY